MSAIFSGCGNYRYLLSREFQAWHLPAKPMLFIMLNPSTADASLDDPTIRRCIGFAKREGCTELHVVNLFSLRATNPEELTSNIDPIGSENDRWLREQIEGHRKEGAPIIAAWGAHPFAQKRGQEVLRIHGPFQCLGMTKNGSPRHPLYVKSDTPLTTLYDEEDEPEIIECPIGCGGCSCHIYPPCGHCTDGHGEERQ